MTLQFNLVSEIIAEAAYRADILGQDDRHPPANQLRCFNDSAQKFRSMITDLGFEWFLKFTAAQNLSTNPQAANETFSEEDWPLEAARIYGVHVLMQSGFWKPLSPIGVQGIRDYQYSQNGLGYMGSGEAPEVFALRLAPSGVGAVETVGKIAIAPLPRVARPFRLVYMPVFTKLATTDTYNGIESHVEWIIWDMVIKYSARDNNARETYGIAREERANVQDMFTKSAQRAQMVAAMSPRRADSFEGDYGPRELL